jgi:hypothetical protein
VKVLFATLIKLNIAIPIPIIATKKARVNKKMNQIVKKTRQTSKNKPNNYVDGKTLHNQLVEWYITPMGTEIPSIIVNAIIQICERLGTSRNFRGYTYLSEMIGAGLLSCVAALQQRKYNPAKGENPFAYFTQIAYNEFIRVITEEQKETYLKHAALQHHIIQSMLIGESIELPENDQSGRLDALVTKFEKKKKKKDEQ